MKRYTIEEIVAIAAGLDNSDNVKLLESFRSSMIDSINKKAFTEIDRTAPHFLHHNRNMLHNVIITHKYQEEVLIKFIESMPLKKLEAIYIDKSRPQHNEAPLAGKVWEKYRSSLIKSLFGKDKKQDLSNSKFESYMNSLRG